MRAVLAIVVCTAACASAPPERARNNSGPPPQATTTRDKPAAPAPSLPASIERARLEKDVAWLSRIRPPKSAPHREIRRGLGERLEALGFAVERHDYGTGVNVVGRSAGRTEEQLIVSAHYDHIAGCRGADDNASGVAAALEIARSLGAKKRSCTLVVAFWDEEETGLFGSRAFATRARDRNDEIRLAISLDAVGFAKSEPNTQRVPEELAAALPEQAARLRQRNNAADFVALIANTAASDTIAVFERNAAATRLPVLSLALPPLAGLMYPDVFRSDHASFWQNGYPSFVLTDTAEYRNPNYHCLNGRDDPGTLDFDFLERVTRATALTVVDLCEGR